MASTSSSASSNDQGEKLKLKPENFPTYQSHLSSFGPSSSTSSALDYKYKYNVFISFRGVDTRNSFTGHLHRDLIGNGISVFKDDEELDRGKQISPGLLQAIEDSRFSMVVFSKNYATSSWCLDELVYILECSMKPGKSIIPIFYDVDPTDVRHQSGTYAAAFAELENKYPAEKVKKWRFGLSAVANISGWHLDDGSEVELIQKIVKDVSRKLTGTFEGLTGDISNQFQLDGTDFSSDDDELKNDAFLSFNIGDDTVLNFANHLSTALQSKEIVFTAKDNIIEGHDKLGKDIPPKLLQEIKASRLFIIILSTNYAASSWCLDQLVHILECRRTSVSREVIPIFYNVTPSVVRHQTNGYKKAFAEHEENYNHNRERVVRWRSALAEVGSLPGLDLNNGHEQEFITDIVQQVTHKLDERVNCEFQGLVGIDSRLKKLLSILDTSVEDVRMIGIWGMAGISKSTIARVIYEKICHTFDAFCYLPNVREYSYTHGRLVSLQRVLLESLLMEGNIILHNHQVEYGINRISNHFRNKRCLLVLDDVDNLEQLDALAGEAPWFGVGSRIIITTRDAHLLNSKGVDKTYTCEGLNPAEAMKLLSFLA